ncbi:MAG: DEAD/DEAH box helicase family protein [Mollicutes bacterium]|nr:DEAD/DEAH box helicase family protein [Mollicutes bacterium]
MALPDIDILPEYHTVEDNVIENFYIPCLANSISYKRITGFFAGITFQMLGKGLSKLITNGGKMSLIISTRLSPQEEEAIKNGYDQREIVEKNLLNRFKDPADEFEKGYLSLLTYLISNSILDIRVAVIDSLVLTAMEHEKIGIFTDVVGNMVAFSGSGNETPSGLLHNSENFDVYCSWKGDDPYNRCLSKHVYFNKLWDGKFPRACTMPFPQAVKEKIFKYQNYLPKEELERLDDKFVEKAKMERVVEDAEKMPSLGTIKLHDYQTNAIKELRNNNYRGYFDMATGTGKTFTALGGIVDLLNNPNIKTKSFFILIVVPYTHLATQWAEDCRKFGFDPLLAFGQSRKWKKAFEEKVISIKLSQSKVECVIITTGSLLHQFVVNALKDPKVSKRTVFVADEAHNLGAGKIRTILEIDFKYRLGLSATMNRHHDSVGTEKLYDFFEKCCIHYDLGRAIAEGFLSHYRYYPVLVYLDDDELDRYVELSKEISKRSSYENPDDSEDLKRLLLKRALLVAGCKMKLDALKETIKPYKNTYYNLVYCGAVSYTEAIDPSEDSQLKSVMSMLGKDLRMHVEKFTASEDMDARETIKDHFQSKMINAIVAIKCLDEGVNIPCIQRAFILASSTNPKEYIQRRGRVLRLFNPIEKPYAEIFDFVTLTRPLDELGRIDQDYARFESSIAKRELARVEEFSRLSDNAAESYRIIADIKSAYHLDEFNLEGNDNE